MEWVKTHHKTILSTLLTIVLVCSMALFMSFDSFAKQQDSNTVYVSSSDTFLSYHTDDWYRILPDSSGWCNLTNTTSYDVAVAPGFSIDLDSFVDYGLSEVLKFEIYFLLDCVDSNAPDSPIFLDDSNVSIYLNDKKVSVSFDEYSFNSDSSDTYTVSVSFYVDPDDVKSLDNLTVEITSSVTLPGMWTTFSSRLYNGRVSLTYIYDTAEDVIISDLEDLQTDINSNFNDLNSNLDSNFDHLEDILTTPTTDIPVNNDQMSDAVGSIGSALDDYVSADQSIEQSIQSIYDTYNNNPQDYGNSLVGLVSNVKDIANSNLFSACWGFVKDYPVIYWLVNMAIVLCVVTFLLRR